jgi:DNA-binding transcriptional LysR family regulator
MNIPRISLDQWLTFKTVVDQGSYALAAEALNKSQSSVSYGINQLNAHLPQAVLRLEGRKAVLTEAGQVLYRHAEQIIKQANNAETVAKSMAMGFESEVKLALDVLVDIQSTICAFEEFSQDNPNTRLRVLETSLSGTSEALLEKQTDLVIGSVIPAGFSGTPLMQITMLPVASPDHPLIQQRKDIDELELRAYRQVVLRDTGTHREQDAGWLKADQRWTVSHFSSSVKMIKSGLVFGFLPRNWIEQDLQDGGLVQIPLKENIERVLQTYLMLSDKQGAGPATRALHALLIKHLAEKHRV